MRTGQTLTHADLIEATTAGMERKDLSSAAVSRGIGKSTAAVSRALAGETALLATLLEAFEHVTGYTAEEQPRTFKIKRLE